jgi:hypothetical protein
VEVCSSTSLKVACEGRPRSNGVYGLQMHYEHVEETIGTRPREVYGKKSPAATSEAAARLADYVHCDSKRTEVLEFSGRNHTTVAMMM